jgi:hypothetical protein
MAVYSYVVDHGTESPSVGIDTKVNGYPVVAVAFYDLVERMEEVRTLLEMSNKESAYDDIQQALTKL